MSPEVRITLIRSAALLVPMSYALAGLRLRRPGPREAGALLLSFLWNIPTLLLLNIAAQRLGCWSFHAEGGLFYGIPLDLLVGWAVLWGPLAGLAVLYVSPLLVGLLFFLLDLLIMPACAPVVKLESSWLAGEAVAVCVCLLPSVYLVRWTTRRKFLPARAILQMFIYTGLFIILVPLTAFEHSNRFPTWHWTTTPLLHLLFFAALPGVSALQEFVTRGRGTPFPYDPTQHLVTTGLYAYVRNPMQLTTVLIFVVLAPLLQNWWLLVAAVMTIAYSAGLAWWHETTEFETRFGPAWQTYSGNVPLWMPRFTPWRETAATLYIDFDCEVCQQVRQWFLARGATKLRISPASEHPTRDLMRISYEDGAFQADGVQAIARALEHINFTWALVGSVLRLPVLSWFFQMISDAVIPLHWVHRRRG